MADFGAPPTANYTPPDGLKTLGEIMSLRQKNQDLQSGALGIQAQQQGLQGQVSQNQSLASKAQGDTQDMQERQAYTAMMKSGKDDQGNSLYTADATGHQSPNLSVVIPALGRIAPKNAQALSQSLIQTEKDKVGLQTSSVQLDAANRQNLQGIVQSGVANNSQDVNASVDQYVQQHPEAQQTGDFIKKLTPYLDKAQDPKARQSMVQSLASRLQPGTSVQTQATPGQMDVGGKIQPGLEGPAVTGGGFTPTGKAVNKTLSPQVVTPPGGIPTVLGANAPPGTAVPARNGPTPTDQDLSRQNAYEANLNSRVQVGTDAKAVIKEKESALQAIKSGAGSSTRASIAKSLQAMGAPDGLVNAVSGGDLGATQEAEKMLFQTTMMGLRQSMQGDSAHVAEFNEANKVFPNIDTDPKAKAKIMSFISDKADRDYAEQQSLNSSKKDGSFNPATWQADYQQKLRAGSVPGTPSSQVPTPAGTPVEASPHKAPSQKALNFLHQHPETADKFKAVYGFVPK